MQKKKIMAIIFAVFSLIVILGIVNLASSKKIKPPEIVASGFINYDGRIQMQYGLDQETGYVIWNSLGGRYEIDIPAIDYIWWGYSTTVTPSGVPYGGVGARTDSINGDLIVQIFDADGNSIQSDFAFVVLAAENYPPPS